MNTIVSEKAFKRFVAIIENLINKRRLMFEWQYIRKITPWDTNTTPPEVMAFIRATPPGRALDLGCGTGTNAITMARAGWEVCGVDFSARAITAARKKAKKAGLAIAFHTADVTALDMLDAPFDYVLDIGCLISIDNGKRGSYAETIRRLTRSGACYMLYAWLPRPWKGRIWGVSPEEVEKLLGPAFVCQNVVKGEERGFGSAWHWYEKR